MALLGGIVLLFQALLLAHGGLTTLGANIFSMAIVGPWVAYGVWRGMRGAHLPASWAIFFAAVLGDFSTYCVTATQLALAHHANGFWSAWSNFLLLYAPTQVPLALAEGIVTVLVFFALRTTAARDLLTLGVLKKSELTAATPAAAPAA